MILAYLFYSIFRLIIVTVLPSKQGIQKPCYYNILLQSSVFGLSLFSSKICESQYYYYGLLNVLLEYKSWTNADPIYIFGSLAKWRGEFGYRILPTLQEGSGVLSEFFFFSKAKKCLGTIWQISRNIPLSADTMVEFPTDFDRFSSIITSRPRNLARLKVFIHISIYLLISIPAIKFILN